MTNRSKQATTEWTWSVVVMTLILLAPQVACVGFFAYVWHSYPLAPFDFSADGLGMWLVVAVTIFCTDAVFVLLCEKGLMLRRQQLVDAVVKEEVTNALNAASQAKASESALREALATANDRLYSAGLPGAYEDGVQTGKARQFVKPQ